jgi:hypothetical protein
MYYYIIQVSKGASEALEAGPHLHLSGYNTLLLQASLYINVLYPESTKGAFDTIFIT